MLIKTWRDPYEAGFSPTKPKQIELRPGLTVLIGCNGAGKSTLIQNIEEECKENCIPCHSFDNLNNTQSSIGSLIGGYHDFDCDSMELGISMWNSSEGEAIKLNIGRQSTLYKEFLTSGFFKDGKYKMRNIFKDENEKAEEEINSDKRRVLLYDATDSGLSVDNIIEIKLMFENMLNVSKELGVKLYIIIAANEYELCRNEQCFDVNTGVYRTFTDYEDYRRFVIESRKRKEKRIAAQIKWQEKQKEKEAKKYEILKQKTIDKVNKLKANKKEHSDTDYKWALYEAQRELSDFIRNAQYNKFSPLEVE